MSDDQTTAWDGFPPDPERDGWHWLAPAIDPTLPPGAYRWHAPPRADVVGMWAGSYPKDMVRRGYTYVAPCIMPDEAKQMRVERGLLRGALRTLIAWGREVPASRDTDHRERGYMAFDKAKRALRGKR